MLKRRHLDEGVSRKFLSQRLRFLVRHAYKNVGLYRTKYDEACVKPADIRSVEDIHKLPIITKDDLRRSFPQDILAQNKKIKNCFTVSTTGHTGTPVRIYKSKRLLRLASTGLLLSLPILPRIIESWAGCKTKRRITIILPVDDEYDVYRILKHTLDLTQFLGGFLQYIDAVENPREHIRIKERGIYRRSIKTKHYYLY